MISRWKLYEDENTNAWECPECWYVHQLNDGTPVENNMNYCPACGTRLITEEFISKMELKTCPFCGGEAHLMSEGKTFFVECECGVSSAKEADKRLAMMSWNRRAYS